MTNLTTRSQRQVINNIIQEDEEVLRVRKLEEDARRSRVIRSSRDDLIALRAANGGRKRYGDVVQIVNKYRQMGYDFVTRGTLAYQLLLLKEEVPKEVDVSAASSYVSSLTGSHISTIPYHSRGFEYHVTIDQPNDYSSTSTDTITANTVNTGGRPKGSSLVAKQNRSEAIKNAITEATIMYAVAKSNNENEGKFSVPAGTLTSILRFVEDKHSIGDSTLRSSTIRNRVLRCNHTGEARQRISPIADVEPLLVEYCIRLSKIGTPLTQSEVRCLAFSLIQGTEYQRDMIVFKSKRHLLNVSDGSELSDTDILGTRWYNGFMNRNKDKLKRGRGRIRDIKRHTFCTAESFRDMYECIYESMVDAGVAIKLEEPVMYDRSGNETLDGNVAFGRPSQYKIIRPQMLLFVDECGCNTNQSSDGYAGGQLFVLPAGEQSTGILGMVTDLHFTVLCFNAGNGEPVMCAVILKSEKQTHELPYNWVFGIDLTKNILTGKTDAHMFEMNSNDGQAMSGGPTCIFNGKTVPCFVCASPKASISSQLLADMLAFMDSLNLFDRSDGIRPFLLLDGHHSRFEIPFLDYIHNKEHEWVCCIGVPYGTHIWQVADSPQMNGAFKINLTIAKRRLFQLKAGIRKSNFEMTDIIPLVRKAWEESFVNISGAKTAICERGWGPLNFALLDHPSLSVKNTATSNRPCTDIKKLNTSSGMAADMFDKLMEDKSKDEARVATLKKRKRYFDKLASEAEKLKSLTRISSGQLAGVAKYNVCSHTRDAIKNNLEKNEKKQKEQEA
jgi:hypothetical protein